jgi:hypothetical protein
LEERGLIGHILVGLGHIKLEQVEEALRKQGAYPGLKLGVILIAMEALTPEQLEKGLKLQERVRRLEREGT